MQKQSTERWLLFKIFHQVQWASCWTIENVSLKLKQTPWLVNITNITALISCYWNIKASWSQTSRYTSSCKWRENIVPTHWLAGCTENTNKSTCWREIITPRVRCFRAGWKQPAAPAEMLLSPSLLPESRGSRTSVSTARGPHMFPRIWPLPPHHRSSATLSLPQTSWGRIWVLYSGY